MWFRQASYEAIFESAHTVLSAGKQLAALRNYVNNADTVVDAWGAIAPVYNMTVVLGNWKDSSVYTMFYAQQALLPSLTWSSKQQSSTLSTAALSRPGTPGPCADLIRGSPRVMPEPARLHL